MKDGDFREGMKKIEGAFGHSYNIPATRVIWEVVSRWREETWKKAVNNLILTFVPTSSCNLPVPANFILSKNEVTVVDEYIRPKVDENDLITSKEFREIMKPLYDAWKIKDGNGKYGVRNTHVDGVYVCDLCHRKGCEGRESLPKEGCKAFLSDEAAKEIKERNINIINPN